MKESINKAYNVLRKSAITGNSILNGIIGDHLEKNFNPASIKMNFYQNDNLIKLTSQSIKNVHPNPSPNIFILVHGLVSNEHFWDFKETPEINYGALLEKDFNITPFYLRFNSGLHISENGQELSALIEKLFESYPIPIESINFISHSMGGLITRSACYYAEQDNKKWVTKVKKIFFLGSPHLGAPLEKLGNVTSHILKTIPNFVTNIIASVADLRSAGMKDLRYGYIHHEEWEGKNPDALLENNKLPIPLMKNATHYVITGSITEDPEHFLSLWLGDSLVRKPSALAKSSDEKFCLNFEGEHLKEFPGVAHLGLMANQKVYDQIKTWIAE